jgi:urease accessory protein
VFADALTLDGSIEKILARPAVAASAAAIATLVQVAPGAETQLDALRAAFGNEIEAGASAFDGILIARIIAPDGFMLRRAVLDALAALDCAPPPAFTL